jgi:hypothetical protein
MSYSDASTCSFQVLLPLEPFDDKVQQQIQSALQNRGKIMASVLTKRRANRRGSIGDRLSRVARASESSRATKILTAADKLVWALHNGFGQCQHGAWQQQGQGVQGCHWMLWDRWAGVEGAPEMHWHHVDPQIKWRTIADYCAPHNIHESDYYRMFEFECRMKCVYVCASHHESYH